MKNILFTTNSETEYSVRRSIDLITGNLQINDQPHNLGPNKKSSIKEGQLSQRRA